MFVTRNGAPTGGLFSEDQPDNWDRYIALKLNPSGRNLWRRCYASTMSRQDTLNGVAVDSLENPYVTGASEPKLASPPAAAHSELACLLLERAIGTPRSCHRAGNCNLAAVLHHGGVFRLPSPTHSRLGGGFPNFLAIARKFGKWVSETTTMFLVCVRTTRRIWSSCILTARHAGIGMDIHPQFLAAIWLAGEARTRSMPKVACDE